MPKCKKINKDTILLIIGISILSIFIIAIFSWGYIYEVYENNQQKQLEKRKELNSYNINTELALNIFCVDATTYKNEQGRIIITDYKIKTKELATKIYVYKEKHGEFSDLNVFYKNYKNDKYYLDGKTSGVYEKIYIDSIGDFSPEFQKELKQQQTEIEKIEEWLKDGQIQKLEEWLNNQEF